MTKKRPPKYKTPKKDKKAILKKQAAKNRKTNRQQVAPTITYQNRDGETMTFKSIIQFKAYKRKILKDKE
jgi:hypothetical protein